MATKKAVKNKEPKLRFTVRHALADIYVVILFSIFPLFLSNGYSACRRDKFWFLLISTGVFGIAVGVLSIIDIYARDNEYNKKLNTYRDPFKLTAVDISFFAFVGVSLISTLTSGRLVHCLVGLSAGSSSGRNMGLITIFILLIGYMVISRFFFYNKYVFLFFFASITIVVGLALLNYYYIDPMNNFTPYLGSTQEDFVVNNFTSTIGNKNYLSALICVSLPFSIGISLITEDKLMRIIGYISTGFQFMGLLIATSDGGFLGVFTALGVIAVFVAKDTIKLFRLCLAVSVMMLSAKILWLYDLIMKGNSKGYSSFSEFFIFNNAVYLILGVFVALTIILYLYHNKTKNDTLPPIVLYTILGIIGLVVLVALILFIYYTFINTEVKLTGFKKFFRFDIKWGTHRGYFWYRSFEILGKRNLWQLLVGTGPETFYYAFKPYFADLTYRFGENTCNAAHNVYINYLITHGILGLGAYLALVVSAIYSCVKNAKHNPLSFVCLGVVVAFAAQDFVNIANPVNTPWFIAFIALNQSTLLRANSSERLGAIGF